MSSRSSRRLLNLRIVTSGPDSDSGGSTAFTRLPSGRRASTIGEDSSMRRPTWATILLMIRRRCDSSVNRTVVSNSRPSRSTQTSNGPLIMISRDASRPPAGARAARGRGCRRRSRRRSRSRSSRAMPVSAVELVRMSAMTRSRMRARVDVGVEELAARGRRSPRSGSRFLTSANGSSTTVAVPGGPFASRSWSSISAFLPQQPPAPALGLRRWPSPLSGEPVERRPAQRNASCGLRARLGDGRSACPR